MTTRWDEGDSMDEMELGAVELEEISTKKGKAKGKGKAKEVSKEVKRRSSKACDNCRKSKCKCTRDTDDDGADGAKCHNCITVGTECTYLGQSKKRGPPKGYIEAIESRLHRMEALLGGLLTNEDPRAQALLAELVGNSEARELLTSDLRAATAADESGTAPRKSWAANPPMLESSRKRDSWLVDQPMTSAMAFPSLAESSTPSSSGIYSNPVTFGNISSSHHGRTHPPSNLNDLTTSSNVFSGVGSNPRDSISIAPGDSPRTQRRRLNALPIHPLASTAMIPPIGSYAFQSQQPRSVSQILSPNAIGHTGQATYVLSPEAELNTQDFRNGGARAAEGADGMTELADVVGQLSLNENKEVRYHGRSSGLYLISKSQRYKDFFWQFPSAGVWPSTDRSVQLTESEILGVSHISEALPDRVTQAHLLDLYWCYVHPHFPILYKVSFMRQYRHTMSNPNSTEPSTPSGSGKVPVVLLLAMFALASRYSNLKSDGSPSTSGQEYLEKAKLVMNHGYVVSKLVSVQALLLMAYREIGTGGMSASWLFTGMAIRMAQDLGLFRDVEKWFLPVQRFSYEEKQTRKRVWWGCIILDRYTASYIGRPGTIHERDYDTSFPLEDEPDEHEQWRPIRPDGSDWTEGPKLEFEDTRSQTLRYPACKAHTLSCFSAAGALAVIINRIITNIYAIRTRVLGQSSETLLTLLDQSLASWFVALPPQLAYTPQSKKVPPPHILSLHLQFYSALILLHRPFIPGQNSASSPTSFPSHSICTTSASAIANIVSTFSKTFTLRQCPPFLTYPIFSAGIMCVYNAGFDETLARQAKVNLRACMDALEEMEVIWGSASRQWELLNGLVDLRDPDLAADLHGSQAADEKTRGRKRSADMDTFGTRSQTDPFSNLQPANFHSHPLGRPSSLFSEENQGRSSSTSSAPRNRPVESPSLSLPPTLKGSFVPPSASVQPSVTLPTQREGMFSFSPEEMQHQTYNILNASSGDINISPFTSRPGTSGGGNTNYTDLLNSFLSSTEPTFETSPPGNQTQQDEVFSSSAAFFGMPLSADLTEEWRSYLPQAFYSPDQEDRVE